MWSSYKGNKLCSFFNTKRGCRSGNTCRFRHDLSANTRPHAPTDNTNNLNRDKIRFTPAADISVPEPSAAQLAFQEWRYGIPLSTARTIKPVNLQQFFEQALILVDGNDRTPADPAIMQETILKLTSNEGLIRVEELLKQDFASSGASAESRVLHDQILPLFHILHSGNVRSSIICERALINIYNCLYGPHGTRGASLFGSVVSALSLEDAPTGDGTSVSFVTAYHVLTQMIEHNGGANVNHDLITAATIFLNFALMHDLTINSSITAEIKTISSKLNNLLDLGRQISTRLASRPVTTSKAVFEQKLRPAGGRHSNDHADFRRISILPTFEEVQGYHDEYLPTRSTFNPNFTVFDSLLDFNFRLLRESTIGQLRDAVRSHSMTSNDPSVQLSNRISFLYRDVQLVDIHFDRKSAIEMLFQFEQPFKSKRDTTQQRKERWAKSRRLQRDALVCLLGRSGRFVYCTVRGEDQAEGAQAGKPIAGTGAEISLKERNLYNDQDHAYVMLKLESSSSADLETLLVDVCSREGGENCFLVEFPGVLLAGFKPTLLALQTMMNTQDMPLKELIALEDGAHIRIAQPVYSQTPGFRFKLDVITANNLQLSFDPSQEFDVERLCDSSTLDQAQAKSLLHCLRNSLALLQGPPGTGKSFIGVALIKVILASITQSQRGPIVCVTFTNHALDQLLEHLYDGGVKNIIRVGSRSKSEKLADVNLRKIAENTERTRPERVLASVLHQKLQHDEIELKDLLQQFQNIDSLQAIEQHLRTTNSEHADQLFSLKFDEDGFQTIDHSRDKNPVQSWLRRGFRNSCAPRSLHDLQSTQLTEMSHDERNILYQAWITSIRERIKDRLLVAYETEQKHSAELAQLHQERDLRCLQSAEVIGLTTSALAKNLPTIRKLRAKVMLCEEAGEVLEAHLLPAMLPSLQHVILIGDHQQLRPTVEYNFSQESVQGKKYSLDVSLFERLVDNPFGQANLPFATLETQRRMHPQISKLIRQTLYSKLQDGSYVNTYPQVVGVQNRLHWFDHNIPEDVDELGGDKSHSNAFEVELVKAFISHLIKQGIYGSNEIAVLTPYVSQLLALKKALSAHTVITIGDRDVEDAIKQGIDLDAPSNTITSSKSSMLKAIRLATVDNFQGEEAKVVVISLVRSNPQGKCGFLKTSNRINVLLSRAKHGMYIFGNAETARSVPMWAQVIEMLSEDGSLGTSLALKCPRHPEDNIRVTNVLDFHRNSPEGGCNRLCASRLDCGHPCKQKCHSDLLHQVVHCLEPCERLVAGCEHACPNVCGDPCIKDCKVPMPGDVAFLPCGHSINNPLCWELQHPNHVICREDVKKTVSICQHENLVRCNVNVDADVYSCSSECGVVLTCGHTCRQTCGGCTKEANGLPTPGSHKSCKQICGRPFTSCDHYCSGQCHGERPCPPCAQQCGLQCVHSACHRPCCEPCAPCAASVCQSGCAHKRCDMPCSAPCDHIPCNLRCERTLENCGHRCPSVCGEECPTSQYCKECTGDSELTSRVVDLIMYATYGDLDLDVEPCIFPPCGHFLTLSSMDGVMLMKEFYNLDPVSELPQSVKSDVLPQNAQVSTCPECRGSLLSLKRYSRVARQALLIKCTKRFISWANSLAVPLAESSHKIQDNLAASRQNTTIVELVLPITSLHGSRSEQVKTMLTHTTNTKRYTQIGDLLARLDACKARVSESEQPIQKVWGYVESKRRRNPAAITNFSFPSEMIQTRPHLLVQAECVRAYLTLLVDFLAVAVYDPCALKIVLQEVRTEVLSLCDQAMTAVQPGIALEAKLFFVRLCAIECSHFSRQVSMSLHRNTSEREVSSIRESLKGVQDLGREHLAQAVSMREYSAGSTEYLAAELQAVTTMIEECTAQDVLRPEEMKAIYEAMKREFAGTGHWYHCENGHLFTIGECGRAMQVGRCPQCGATIGGARHHTVEGVTNARDFERQMEEMRLVG